MHTLGQPMWLGQYRLTSRVATGGMAEVYVGRHIGEGGQFGPLVAVKRLLPHLAPDASIVRMFLNEARITAQISHPNVVRVFELGQVDGEPFIAMELLDGRTWAELRSRAAENGRRMPMGVALAILTQACLGLDAAHHAEDDEGHPLALVHRDFTPDNIHVGFLGEVKVIDFGIAKTRSLSSGTEPGTLKGKFFYMSPEMILGKTVDHRADLFAAGVMLYEQLCGRRPFTGHSIDEVVIRIAQGTPQPPSAFDPAVPRALEAICLQALAKDPAERFQTLGALVEALRSVGGEAELATREEVGAYVSSLFPEKTDARRQTLRMARERDPSMPFVRNPSLPEGAPAAEPRPLVVTPASPTPPVPLPAVRTPLPRWLLPAAGAAVALVLAVAAAVVLRSKPLSPAEALAAAQAQPPSERARLLLPLGRSPESTDEHLARAAALLLEARQYDATLELVDRWLERAPRSLEARLAEAAAATASRKGRRAEQAAREAAALSPKDARPDVALAELKELQGDAGGALEAWTRAAAKAPTARARARQGYWLSQTGRLEEADEVLTRALRGQKDAALTAELGFVKFRREQPEAALRLLRAAVAERPGLLEGHYYLGAVLYRQGDLKGARAEYLEADRLAGSDTRPLAALCELDQQQPQLGQLEDTRRRVKERFPQEAEALLARCDAVRPAE